MKIYKLIFIFFLILIPIFYSFSQSGFQEIQFKLLRILSNIIKFIFSFFMIVAVILLIFLGIKYIGNWGNIQEMHKSILYLIIGIVLLILSFFVPNLIKSFIDNAIN